MSETSVMENTEVAAIALRKELGLLTEDEVASIWGVEVGTVRNWRSRREGPPYVTYGRAALYRRDAFLDWLKKLERKPER